MTTPTKFNRRSIRLDGYDYASTGAYFVTICANKNVIDINLVRRGDACVALNSNSDSTNVFGHIENGKMVLNEFGSILEQCWHALPEHHKMIIQDEFIVMPNHVHFIVMIENVCTVDTGQGKAGQGKAGQGKAGQGKAGLAPTDKIKSKLDPFENVCTVDTGQGKAGLAPTDIFNVRYTKTGTIPRPKKGSLGTIVGSYKSSVTRHINEHRGTPGAKVWQRNYFDRIIRHEEELNRTREYIVNNPASWDTDEHNRDAIAEAVTREIDSREGL